MIIFLMIRRPPRSTRKESSAASDVYKRQDIGWIDAETLDIKKLANYDGILVPGGFGTRAIEGKIRAIKYAHEHNIPFLGICFGMQLAIIEALRTIPSLKKASSSEFGACEHPVIAKMEEWAQDDIIVKVRAGMGGTMRLGAYPCELEKGSLASKIYGKSKIEERHRHRSVSYTHLRAHETDSYLVCRLLLEKNMTVTA